MKKIVVYIFMIFSILSFSKDFWEKDEFVVNVVEKRTINKKNRKKEYIMNYKDGKMVLTIIKPDINKGEVYTFSENEKTIYYPTLKQTIKQEIKEDEINLLRIFNLLKNIKAKKSFETNKNNYIFEKEALKEISGNDYSVKFSNYKKHEEYSYPSKIDLNYSNIEINYEFNDFR